MFKISSKVKYSSLILLLAVVVMFYSTALPFSAAVEPSYEYVPVTIDMEELAYLLDIRSSSSVSILAGEGADVVVYSNNTFNVFTGSSFEQVFLPFFDYPFSDSVDNILYCFPESVDGFSEAYSFEFVEHMQYAILLDLPFDFILDTDTVFSFGFMFQDVLSGLAGVDSGVFLKNVVTLEETPVGISYYLGTTVTPVFDHDFAYWYFDDFISDDVLVSRNVCFYDFSLTVDEFYDPSNIASSTLNFLCSIEVGGENGVSLALNQIFFPCFYLKPFTIYVREEVLPTVEDYFSAITNPSPESKAEVERLEQELEEISEQLREDASDLEVEKPDISDSVEDLPSEVVDGMDEVGQTVLSPLMNLELIATLFSVLFGVVALKLILFGSGTS